MICVLGWVFGLNAVVFELLQPAGILRWGNFGSGSLLVGLFGRARWFWIVLI